MNSLDKIITHSFITKVTDDSMGLEETGEENYSELDLYINNTAFYSVHLVSLLDQLKNAIEGLSHYKYGRNQDLDRGKHFTYNYENYLIRLTSISDRLLQTINAVYYLGIDEKDVSERIILNNDKISLTSLPKEFKSFKRVLNNYIPIRNKIVHRNSHLTKQIIQLEKIYHPTISQRIFDTASDEEIERFKKLRSRVLTDVIKKTKEEFKGINETCFELILPILDILNIQYDKIKNCF